MQKWSTRAPDQREKKRLNLQAQFDPAVAGLQTGETIRRLPTRAAAASVEAAYSAWSALALLRATSLMWTLNVQEERPGSLLATLGAGPRPLTHAEIVRGWHEDDAFADFWSGSLAAMPIEAFCWEMPPLTKDRLESPFECMIIESPHLALMWENARPYAAYFAAGPAEGCVSFPNLSGDCTLVSPVPAADEDTEHTHLAIFLRTASRPHVRVFWKGVAEATLAKLEEGPVWVSTAGLGVGWLHVRVSSVPKYYRCQKYARALESGADGTIL